MPDRPLEAALDVLGSNGFIRLDGLAIAAANLRAAAAKM